MKMKNNQIIRIYLLTMCFLSVTTFAFFCVFRGTGFHQIFVSDPHDVFMDHFNVMSMYTICDPYENYLNSYPAFVCLIWELFAHIIPIETRISFTPYALRENHYAMIPFLLFLLLCLWSFSVCIKVKADFDKYTESVLLLAILLSSPMLFTLDRGNIIILALVLTTFFVFFRNSDNGIVRELAYVSLALASAIKIYPAILGLLLVTERKLKDAIRLMVYGVVAFFCPFFVFFDGFSSIKYMLQGLTVVVGNERGCGYQYSFSNFISIVSRVLEIELSNTFTNAILFFVFVCLIVSSFVIKEEWKQVLALTILMIIVPGFSATYVLIFLFIPFVLFLIQLKKHEVISKKDKVYAILFFIIMAPFLSKPVSKFSNDLYVLTYGMILENIALISLAFLLISEMYSELFPKKKHTN